MDLKKILNGKKVLVIMPFYFGYEHTICNALVELGSEIYLINENYYDQNMFSRLAFVYLKKSKNLISEKYYNKNLKNIPSDISYILVIKGSTLTEMTLWDMKKRWPNAYYIIYQWDSIANAPEGLAISKYFNKQLTFDEIDSKAFGWDYRPLFFDVSHYIKMEDKYDLVFICSLHSERIKVFHYIKTMADKNNLTYYDYLYSEKISFLRQKYIRHNDSFNIKDQYIKFKPLSMEDTHAIYNKGKCIIDYKFPKQNGLTMRTIESIGHRCKLITNNKNIKNADFYDPNNIYIYDLDNFYIPLEFIKKPYKDIDSEVYARYSVQGWLTDVFSEGGK